MIDKADRVQTMSRDEIKAECKMAVTLNAMPVSRACFSIALPAYDYTHPLDILFNSHDPVDPQEL